MSIYSKKMLLLCAISVVAFASCQKENTEVFPIEQKTKQLVTQKISLTYTINEAGQTHHFKLDNIE